MNDNVIGKFYLIKEGAINMNTKTVVLNAERMNFDKKLDFSILSDDVTVYDSTPEELMLERIEGAGIIVTKEIPVKGEMIEKFPDSVKLICEAGTGYNNIDLEAAKKKGTYSHYVYFKFKLNNAGSAGNAYKRKSRQFHKMPSGKPC